MDRAIGLPAALVVNPNHDELEVCRRSFVHAMAIEFGVPLITGAFRGETANGVGRALEYGRGRVGGRVGSAHVRAEHIANPRQGFGRIHGHAGKNLCRRQYVVVLIGVKSGGHSKLAELADTHSIARFGLRSAEGRQEQGGEDADDGDDNEQFDQREATATFINTSL